MFRLNVQAQTVTLPLNVYLDLCSQHASNDEMDEFLMYIYKVKRCPRTRAHDWTECPYAHRGEKARRRDPRKFPYQGVVCPEFKNGECKKGQNCECAHGIFEFWLHPSRFRTRVCESGVLCPRKVCFFAHTPEQLRPEGLHHCSRCAQRASTTDAAPAAAAAAHTKEKAKKLEAPPPTAPTETTPAVLAVPSSSADAAEGSSGSARVAREAVDEKYTDFSHLGWVVDLVDW